MRSNGRRAGASAWRPSGAALRFGLNDEAQMLRKTTEALLAPVAMVEVQLIHRHHGRVLAIAPGVRLPGLQHLHVDERIAGDRDDVGVAAGLHGADVVRVADDVLAEHWDVLQDEATEAESQSGLPMFGTTFPE